MIDRKLFSTSLAKYQDAVDTALAEMKDNKIMARIWSHDHTVWKPEPAEIINRLGWLHIPEMMLNAIPRMEELANNLLTEGYTHVLLMGMGGSSLAPEVFRKTFGVGRKNLDLSILDSTDPDSIRALSENLDLSKTLFIVATKSGGTTETLSFFNYFYNQIINFVGLEKAGDHFIAITDPGSKLEKIANTCNFRTTFLNDPDIGGRYSALSYFGLVPAALIGMDLEALLKRAVMAQEICKSSSSVVEGNNLAVQLGVIMGELAKEANGLSKRDKLTLVISPEISSFGDWVEQLVAESTGKDGLGILPVVGEPLGSPDVYGDDRYFVYMRLTNNDTNDAAIQELMDAGYPVVRIDLDDKYDLGAQFFLWEMATVVAGYRLQINPFDQPNVESAKILARRMVDEYMEKGELPSGEFAALSPDELDLFLCDSVSPGSYIALQAYLQPTSEIKTALQNLRLKLRNHYMVATTLGFGPRFLHSTGQMHKGDSGNGIFVQFTSSTSHDIPIPDEAGEDESAMGFGVLKASQALGDAQALLDAGRQLIRFDLGTAIIENLKSLGE